MNEHTINQVQWFAQSHKEETAKRSTEYLDPSPMLCSGHWALQIAISNKKARSTKEKWAQLCLWLC